MQKLLLKVTSGPVHSFSITKESSDKFYDEFHYHPEYELTLIIKGNGTRFVGDHIACFEDGDLVLLGSDLPHVWKSEKNNVSQSMSMALHFDRDFMGKGFFDRPELSAINKVLDISSRGLLITGKIKDEISSLMCNLPEKSSAEQLITLLQILHLISQIPKPVLISNARFSRELCTGDADRIKNVYDYVSSNFSKQITLEEVAEIAHMTRTSFCRYFKQRTKKNFTTFVNEMRVYHACKLLHDGNMKIAHVGFESGFSNLSNFNKQFKSIINRTPMEYHRMVSNR